MTAFEPPDLVPRHVQLGAERLLVFHDARERLLDRIVALVEGEVHVEQVFDARRLRRVIGVLLARQVLGDVVRVHQRRERFVTQRLAEPVDLVHVQSLPFCEGPAGHEEDGRNTQPLQDRQRELVLDAQGRTGDDGPFHDAS